MMARDKGKNKFVVETSSEREEEKVSCRHGASGSSAAAGISEGDVHAESDKETDTSGRMNLGQYPIRLRHPHFILHPNSRHTCIARTILVGR